MWVSKCADLKNAFTVSSLVKKLLNLDYGYFLNLDYGHFLNLDYGHLKS